MKINVDLPVQEAVPELCRALENGRNAVLEAPPGAGKTTIVPLALLDEPWLAGRRIIMLEPRRLAARSAAYRMAFLSGEEVGRTIGYRTRLDSIVGPSTRIEVVTEGILTRFLQGDPSLDGVGMLIFDEFHERSLNADLGLALSLETQSALREDLRILVMSATLNGTEVSNLLGDAPVIKSFGRTYPVTLRYLPNSRTPSRSEGVTRGGGGGGGPEFISLVTGSIFKAIKEESGSILVFLPGAGEIRRVEELLMDGGVPENVDIAPLYGELSRDSQDLAIRPSAQGRRKVVLATSIAETSLTIEGIRVVIDGGLMRVPRFSPSIGMGGLETVRVTKASADQRSGRAGRLEPGTSIRLWTEAENRTLRERSTPEILEADLAPLALELSVWGVKDAGELKWLDPPPAGAMAQARELLARLGAMEADGSATGHGKAMARLPVHPRLAHMALKGKELGLGNLACYISALLTERDILKGRERDSDIRHRLEVLAGRSHAAKFEIDRGVCERIKKAAGELRKLLNINIKDKEKEHSFDIEKTGLLLAFAYPDRIAKRRAEGEGRYLLSNGRGAFFRTREFFNEEYVVAASLDGSERESRIFLAAPIKEAELGQHFGGDMAEVESVEWDQAHGGVSAKAQRRLWSLVLSEKQLLRPDKAKVLDALLSGIRQSGLAVLPWDKASENLRARINLLRSLGEEGGGLPELTDKRMVEKLDEWLGPWLAGMTRLEHLRRLDLSEVLFGLLSWDQRRLLDRLAPAFITVPSGSRIHIDYTAERPVLAVRLQEMFGLERTPSIANGKMPLLLHLLSPAGRPVQVTDDLAGFWAASYQLVKKDMKGRYPKHYWPDDPLEAEPTRGAKKRPRSV